MTIGQKAAAKGFALTLAGAAVLAWLFDALPFRVRNPWVTLRRSKQRVFLDDGGRIERGLPRKFRGILLRDLTKVGRQVSKTKRHQRREERRLFPRSRTTFRNKDQAYKELLRANPELHDFLQRHFGHDDRAYLAWRRGGRRGPKPTTGYDDGRLDGINYTWDLHGRRQANNWTEAVFATIPDSRRWEDFAERLPVLAEAAGLPHLQLPEPAARLERAGADREQYREGAELEVEDVYDSARAAATMQISGEPDDDVDDDEPAPF